MKFGRFRRRRRLGTVLRTVAVAAALTGAPISAITQTVAPAADSFATQIRKFVVEAEDAPELKALSPDQRRDLMVFVVGNMLFSVVHELGHAVMSEMELPVLGRQEDAADSYAIFIGLRMMTDVSEHALIEAGKGWFFNELSDRKRGAMASFYDSHGMNLQRAYQIVCFMVGAHPDKFKTLADATNLPASRQQDCKSDYAIVAWSWETLLKPYRRAADRPPTPFKIVYGDSTGSLEVYARAFRDMKFLERIATMASDSYEWRRPLTLGMESCGKVNAFWAEKTGTISVCYELIEEFAKTYLQFMNDPAVEKRMRTMTPPRLTP